MSNLKISIIVLPALPVWRPIPSASGYEVSSCGMVRIVPYLYTDDEYRKYQLFYGQYKETGLCPADIARKFGFPRQTVTGWLKKRKRNYASN